MYILLIFNLFLSLVSASDYDRRLFSPRALSLNGALNSRINLNESLYFNPASAAHSKLTSVESSYGWSYYPEYQKQRSSVYSVSAIDTDGPLFGGGGSYTHWGLPGDKNSSWDLRMNVNKLLLSKKVGFGITGSYTKYNFLDSTTNYKNINLDAGLLILVASKTIVGLSGFNLFGDTNDFKNRYFSFSVRQSLWDFCSFTADFTHLIRQKYAVTGAVELIYKAGFMINLSVRHNRNLQTTLWGVGTGYLGPKVSLLYGTMNSFNAPYSFNHSFSLRVFF